MSNVLLVDPRLERLVELVELAVEQPGGTDHAEAIGVDRGLGEASVLPGHFGGGGRELDLARHHLDALARLDEFLRLEVADLAAPGGDPAGSGKLRQRHDAASAGGNRLPDLLAADADRRNDSQAGDDDFTHEIAIG